MTETHKNRIKAWVKALRSRVYKQTRNALQDDPTEKFGRVGYCCLGVACKVYEKQTKTKLLKKEWEENSALPSVVRKYFGLTNNDPLLKAKVEDDQEYYNYTASELNDSFKFGFKKIASCIEHTFLNKK